MLFRSDSRYVVEPNVKEGKGGLRDLHLLFWLSKYLYRVSQPSELVAKGVLTHGEARHFERAERFFSTVRCHIHYLTGRPDAAWVAGLAYGFCPYRIDQLAHLQVLASFWLPLSLLALHRYWQERRPRWLVLFAGAYLLQGLANGYFLLFIPVLLVIQLMFTTAIALLLSMANVFFRDVKYLVEALMTVWMFSTSVVFPVDRVGGHLGTVLALNPMTPLIEAYRSVILFGRPPSLGAFVYVAIVSSTLLIAAWLFFHRSEFRFAESV